MYPFNYLADGFHRIGLNQSGKSYFFFGNVSLHIPFSHGLVWY